MKKEKTKLVSTSISLGLYYIDNEPVSPQQLCERAEALDPSVRHKGTPEAIMWYSLGLGQHLQYEHLGLKPGEMDSFVTTHEAAEVLRKHGHVVDNKPNP